MNTLPDKQYTIGEVAQRVGVRTSALRYYERIGLLPPVRRVNGQRRYDESAVALLNVALLAQQAGYSLPEQMQLLRGFDAQVPPAERWQTLAGSKLSELDEVIARAQAMKRVIERTLHCTCAEITECAGAAESTGAADSAEGASTSWDA